MSLPAGVPLDYRGVWQRTLYAGVGDEDRHIEDRTTRVIWLQTACWHADLRVPADRPDFADVTSLDDCDRDRLVWLASQTAFAGITRVEGRFCTWHRLLDLHPGLEKDVGEMAWRDDGVLEERHPRGLYLERWVRQTAAHDEECIQLGSDGLPRWLQWGDHAMAIVPRPTLPEAHDLLASPESLETFALRLRAGLEISYAQRANGSWKVVLSTRPWHEGRRISPTSN
ncbi:hypothetical protein MHM84_05515 [Halomonas sp. McH1-25]|uniref:hypothetical protein n=1 Tax=unclassified Halomonas TaxID=2609666 RepID=UPI001EF46E26|nr:MULTISPECIES: hypothetical protein [unclassified Halomonas]MCG7599235.1 hypothetical protein [Halomonas sp. McH1-25]MCP1341103.1 hypothetical protein [Halomonas sp. FL8]MCP1360303.1 hypothetical protein [Halomonas sp. BBD45]MCP1366857.1 hypothetical protein [Halomonas sp. BBD48]